MVLAGGEECPEALPEAPFAAVLGMEEETVEGRASLDLCNKREGL